MNKYWSFRLPSVSRVGFDDACSRLRGLPAAVPAGVEARLSLPSDWALVQAQTCPFALISIFREEK